MKLLETLKSERVLAILRSREGTKLGIVIDELVEQGVNVLEVTLSTPGALDAVAAARLRHGQSALIGAGTVMSAADVDRCADAGAQFVVSPHADESVIMRARERGLESLPGAMTPTEIVNAHRAGATAVKVFPARSVGPHHFADVLAPLADIPLMAVGGIGSTQAASYLDAGAFALGMGSPLIGDALEGGAPEYLRERVKSVRQAIAHWHDERVSVS